MEQSLSIPTATSFRTLHVGTMEQRRAELNAALKQAGRTEKVSFTHLIAFALARAATEQPAITASFRRVDGKPQKIEAGINLGLAVDAQKKDGSRFLVVPVIKNAGALDFAAFRAAYEELVAKARDNKLSVEEQTGAIVHADESRRHRHRRVGAAPDGRPRRDHRGRRDRVPAGLRARIALDARAARRRESHDADVDLRSSRHPRRAVGRVSAARRRAARRRRRVLRDDLRAARRDAAVRGVATSANAAAPTLREHAEPVTADIPGVPSEEMLRAIAAGMALVSAYRRHGHLGANLDPLGTKPPNDPSLDPATYNLTPAMMQAIPASVLNVKLPGRTLADVLPKLRETYSSTIAYEIEHISNTRQREWLREYIETGMHRRRSRRSAACSCSSA